MFKNKILLLIIILLIVVVSLLLIFKFILKKKNIEKEIYIEIAKEKAMSQGFPVKDMYVLFDKNNLEWYKTLGDIKKDNLEYAKRFDVLQGKNYQVIKFYPRSKYTIGNRLWIFIDTETKEVITFYGEM